MSILTENNTVSDSTAVALEISKLCPEALFCGFKTFKQGNEWKKLPISTTGAGVGADIDHQHLIAANAISTSDLPQGAQYWGLFMQKRLTFDPFNELVLTVLDLDAKRSTAPQDIRMKALKRLAEDKGLLYERSHSAKGAHIIFFAQPDDALPAKIALGNSQEIEIFGHPKSGGKNVMLTGSAMHGELKTLGCTVREFLNAAGIQNDAIDPPAPRQVPTPPPMTQYPATSPSDDFQRALEALQHISPDCDYDQWIELGQALHTAFGDQGRSAWANWSAAGSKFKGDADIEAHWKSFHQGKGVGIGTLFKYAKDNGWTPQTKQSQRLSAVEDFANIIKQGLPSEPSTGSPDEPFAIESPAWPELPFDLSRLAPIDYLLEGFMAHSFFILAGQPGVGKTTAVLSLCIVMAGFTVDGCQLHAKRKRKSIIVTEDSDQVIRTLFAYSKHFNIQNLHDWFVIIDARRSNVQDLLRLAHNIEIHTVDNVRPLLVLDTANSTMDIDNENDNSEVGAYIAALKQTIFVQQKTPVVILTHTNKTISRQDSDAMARGASAFTGDATLTGILFMDEENQRYLKLTKTRYEPKFREIKFNSHTFCEPVITKDGDMQEIICRVAIPVMSSEDERTAAKQDKQNDKRQQIVIDLCDEVCSYIQSIINKYPQGVIMRRGSGRPVVPKELLSMHQLEWSEVFEAVPKANQSYSRKSVGTAVFQRFAPATQDAGWTKLE